jgi:nitrate/nitrite transport system permease protein
MTAITATMAMGVSDASTAQANSLGLTPDLKAEARSSHENTATSAVQAKPVAVVSAAFKRRARHDTILKILAPVLGLVLLLLLWELISNGGQTIPGPMVTGQAAIKVLSHPFYDNGPNDQGIGFKVINSLGRVGLGFSLAALVGIPLGFLIGRFSFLNAMVGPIISLLRPVSPLAWLPIGLLVFKGAHPAAIWTIFISSIWPMIINTAVGVQRVPSDYMNVARVLNLSEWKIFTKILFPSVLPYMMTGVRLAIGVAWLVIVAAEMLTGGVGIGFWVWDEWNNLKVENILLAIIIIGVVGLLLEAALMWLANRFNYE